MFVGKNNTWLPDEHQSARMARLMMEVVVWSSERYDLGVMTPEEATALLDFAYIPLRGGYGDLQWQSQVESLRQDRVWSFDTYYDALVKMSPLYNKNEDGKV